MMQANNKYTVENVDWEDKGAYISDHFTVHEATYLPSWGVYHEPSEEEKANILELAHKMEKVRLILGGKPIIVHCWIRPTKVNCPGSNRHRKNYNRHVGSTAENSAHIVGKAVDFRVAGFSGGKRCNTIRQTLVSYLRELGVRMENIPDAPWVHIDTAPVGHNRFFKP